MNNVKGFRQAPQPNKKQIQTALDGTLQKLAGELQMQKNNQQIFLQFLQRNMGEVNRLNGQISNLESLVGFRQSSQPAREDDIVVLSCIGYDPETGLPFGGGRLERAVIRVGSGQLIAEFEKQLIGLAPSEDLVTISVKFPEDYGNKELANKTYKFDLIVLEVYTKVVSTAKFDARAEELVALEKAAKEAQAAKEKSNEQAQTADQAQASETSETKAEQA
jgi:FKBP-type peptidyl-prolyl cis-trans isomerase (trigger factor)